MTVRKRRGSPYWQYDFWYHSRQYRGSTRQKSTLKAQGYERRLRYQLDSGSDPFFRSPPVEELCTLYFGWLEANGSPQHIDRSKRALKNVFDRMAGVKTPDDIRPLRFEQFKKRRLPEVSPNTVNLELRYLRAFIRRCIKQGGGVRCRYNKRTLRFKWSFVLLEHRTCGAMIVF